MAPDLIRGLKMSCANECKFLNAEAIAGNLSARGIACTERAAREMITKKKLPTFKVPFNGTMHVCQRVIDYMIQAEQTRAVQKFMKKSEIILPPPPACLSNVADATEGLTDA